jgi:hypothetical protein
VLVKVTSRIYTLEANGIPDILLNLRQSRTKMVNDRKKKERRKEGKNDRKNDRKYGRTTGRPGKFCEMHVACTRLFDDMFYRERLI